MSSSVWTKQTLLERAREEARLARSYQKQARNCLEWLREASSEAIRVYGYECYAADCKMRRYHATNARLLYACAAQWD